ncbi:aminotransferase [Lutimonas saemankumensis]|uniref:aminotransferase n=1 Tax=Lutimonas saemankumensis TaxID=483016 RepID=UPI001CD51D8E|nr:aminotransferase [Lutimonas saemankumensis]MCA0933653.1 aminotransferase [Lutimonas saemankumensis]
MEKQLKTKETEIWTKDKNHVIHPYTNFNNFKKEGSVIYEKGKDHHIYDMYGKEYIDGIAGLWCVNIGHGNEEISEAMADQSRKLAYYNTFEDAGSIPAADLGAKIASLCPQDLNHVFFGTGGSMANDTAIKMIHYYYNLIGKPNKKKIISRDLAYHGSTYLAHALTGISSTHLAFDLPMNMIHYLTAPYAYRNQNELSETEFCDFLIDEMENYILIEGAENIACFIAEPIMGAGGVIVPPKGYHKRTYELCKKYDIFYISDEVVTAFGRLGHMVTSEEMFGIRPDVIVMAKGLSSGYVPLGATVISDEIYEVISRPKKENPYFSHGFTYSGHPLCCEVGLKNIEILERDEFCQHVQKWGPYFEQQLKTLSDLDIVGDVRGSHYMLSLELVAYKTTKFAFEPEIGIAKRVYHHARKMGLIVRPIGALIVLSPPLTFDKTAIDQSILILRKSIELTMDDLLREKIWKN